MKLKIAKLEELCNGECKLCNGKDKASICEWCYKAMKIKENNERSKFRETRNEEIIVRKLLERMGKHKIEFF